MYLKNTGIKKVEELGQSDKFVRVWSDKINKKYPLDDKIFLIFHSAPITDYNYKDKIDKFKKRLEALTSVKLHHVISATEKDGSDLLYLNVIRTQTPLQ